MGKQHGMLFAERLMPAMVDGRKTQTRRPMRPQPVDDGAGGWKFPWATFWANGTVHTWDSDGCGGQNWNANDYPNEDRFAESIKRAPDDAPIRYRVGDLIWCRETWQQVRQHGHTVKEVESLTPTMQGVCHRASGRKCPITHGMVDLKWRPSIHMPKWACRCWKEIIGVRVERIQSLSDEDAMAEGLEVANFTGWGDEAGLPHIPEPDVYACYRDGQKFWEESPVEAFRWNWEGIYRGSWERNDWVWVLEYKPAEAPQ